MYKHFEKRMIGMIIWMNKSLEQTRSLKFLVKKIVSETVTMETWSEEVVSRRPFYFVSRCDMVLVCSFHMLYQDIINLRRVFRVRICEHLFCLCESFIKLCRLPCHFFLLSSNIRIWRWSSCLATTREKRYFININNYIVIQSVFVLNKVFILEV